MLSPLRYARSSVYVSFCSAVDASNIGGRAQQRCKCARCTPLVRPPTLPPPWPLKACHTLHNHASVPAHVHAPFACPSRHRPRPLSLPTRLCVRVREITYTPPLGRTCDPAPPVPDVVRALCTSRAEPGIW